MKFAYIYATVYATPAYLGPVRWHRGGERVMRGQWAIVSLPLILACLRIFFKIGLHENLRLKNSQFWVIRSKNEMLLCIENTQLSVGILQLPASLLHLQRTPPLILWVYFRSQYDVRTPEFVGRGAPLQ